MNNKIIDIIGVPMWQGSGVKGPEEAPKVLYENGLKERINKTTNIVNSFTIINEISSEKENIFEEGMLNTSIVKHYCKELETLVSESLYQNHFPLIIGGDHALSIGSISGLNHHIKADDLTVIWIDAHTDINTDYVSDSKHIHGMPLAFLFGKGSPIFIDDFGKEKEKLKYKNLYYIGARDIDNPELEFIKEHNIKVYGMSEIKSKGIENVVSEILNNIDTPYIHLSFDVDFMGSEEFTATGLPIPNGPTLSETFKCLPKLMNDNRVSSLDFVEYSPIRDNEGKSGASVCLELLEEIFK